MEIPGTCRFGVLIFVMSGWCASAASTSVASALAAEVATRNVSQPTRRSQSHRYRLKTQDLLEYPPPGSEILANSFSRKFHRPGCEFAMVMRKSRRQWLHSADVAKEQHLIPCCWCFPAFSATVEAQLLTPLPPKSKLTQQNTQTEVIQTERNAKPRTNQ